MDFVFLCVDDNSSRATITNALEKYAVSYIDVGIGVLKSGAGLVGQVRSTLVTSDCSEAKNRVPKENTDVVGEYATNIQIAELNALNASLAVIRWKKLNGIYGDDRAEYNSTYLIQENKIVNEYCAL